MSIYINNVEMEDISYNNQQVDSVYYNNNLVWERPVTPWVDLSWEDLYIMCQNGRFISSVALGNEKTFTVNGQTKTARLVGINTEGQNTLTFQYRYRPEGGDYNTYRYVYKEANDGTFIGWQTSNLRQMCQSDYNNSDIKNYIKTVSKDSCIFSSNELVTLNETFWLGWEPAPAIFPNQEQWAPSILMSDGIATYYWDRGDYCYDFDPTLQYGYWITSGFVNTSTTLSSPHVIHGDSCATISTSGTTYKRSLYPFFTIGV